ncbi:MAG TPA: hypothetical protein VFM12_01890, partial [Gemmatimonadales bacterium]|nr:hypothetical protein [Gemmatimonadales bacterium]
MPQWTVDTHPLAVIGDDPDGSDDVTRVHGPVLLSDGAVAFWDDARGQIAVYEPDGTERRRIGRRGQGPGEFQNIFRLVQSGDTLIAADGGNDRISLYSPHLDLLAVTQGARQCGLAVITGRLPDGRYLADNTMWLQPGLPVTQSTERLASPLFLATPSQCDTLAEFPGAEMRVIETRYRGHRGTQQVFVNYGRRTVSAAWDSLIAVGTEAIWQVDLLTENGNLVRSIRLPWSPRATPAGLKDSIIQQELER